MILFCWEPSRSTETKMAKKRYNNRSYTDYTDFDELMDDESEEQFEENFSLRRRPERIKPSGGKKTKKNRERDNERRKSKDFFNED